MKVIRHILSHMILILVIVGLAAVYFYRYQVLPDKYITQLESYASAIHPKLTEIASSQPVNNVVAVYTSENLQQEQPESTANVMAIIPIAEDTKPGEKEIAVSDDVEKNNVVSTNNEIEEKKIEAVEVKKYNEIVIVDNTKAQVIEEEPAINSPLEPVDSINEDKEETLRANEEVSSEKDMAVAMDLLREARLAYAQGELKQAVKKYSELIELEGEQADFHGELGNVYYAMGNWKYAGASYYEAAIRLLESNQLAQVGYLHRVLQGLDVEKAQQLSAKLASLR